MRYPEGQGPDTDIPYGSTMHSMLDMSMYLSIAIGIVLFVAGRRGKVLWLTVWSVGLILSSLAYLIADRIGLF